MNEMLDMKRRQRDAVVALTAEQYDRACGILLRDISDSVWSQVRAMIASDPKNWILRNRLHFGWGMAVRNLLRDNGFTDSESLSGNLDDIYVPLIEEAARRVKG